MQESGVSLLVVKAKKGRQVWGMFTNRRAGSYICGVLVQTGMGATESWVYWRWRHLLGAGQSVALFSLLA